MHINLERDELNAIEGYSESQVKINSVIYQHNIIVSKHGIQEPWRVKTITQLEEQSIAPLLEHNPKIIIIGHSLTGKFAPISILQTLSKKQISLESMSIGAACRTYNILLSEQREVVLGLLLEPSTLSQGKSTS